MARTRRGVLRMDFGYCDESDEGRESGASEPTGESQRAQSGWGSAGVHAPLWASGLRSVYCTTSVFASRKAASQ